MAVFFRFHDATMSRSLDIHYTAEDVENVRRQWNVEHPVPVPDPVDGTRRSRLCDVSLTAWKVTLSAMARRVLDAWSAGGEPDEKTLTSLHTTAIGLDRKSVV